MKNKMDRIIEVPCEESEKEMIAARIREYLIDKQDYIDGRVQVNTDRLETVDVIIFEGCSSNIKNDIIDVIGWMPEN